MESVQELDSLRSICRDALAFQRCSDCIDKLDREKVCGADCPYRRLIDAVAMLSVPTP